MTILVPPNFDTKRWCQFSNNFFKKYNIKIFSDFLVTKFFFIVIYWNVKFITKNFSDKILKIEGGILTNM